MFKNLIMFKVDYNAYSPEEYDHAFSSMSGGFFNEIPLDFNAILPLPERDESGREYVDVEIDELNRLSKVYRTLKAEERMDKNARRKFERVHGKAALELGEKATNSLVSPLVDAMWARWGCGSNATNVHYTWFTYPVSGRTAWKGIYFETADVLMNGLYSTIRNLLPNAKFALIYADDARARGRLFEAGDNSERRFGFPVSSVNDRSEAIEIRLFMNVLMDAFINQSSMYHMHYVSLGEQTVPQWLVDASDVDADTNAQ